MSEIQIIPLRKNGFSCVFSRKKVWVSKKLTPNGARIDDFKMLTHNGWILSFNVN